MRLWTSARVVPRQRPSPTRRRTRFPARFRHKCVFPSFRANARAIGIDRDAIVRPRETSRLTSAIKTPKPPPYPTTGGAIVRHTAGGSRAGPTVRPRANRRGAPEPCFRRTSERVKSRESSSSSSPASRTRPLLLSPLTIPVSPRDRTSRQDARRGGAAVLRADRREDAALLLPVGRGGRAADDATDQSGRLRRRRAATRPPGAWW